MFYVLGPPNKFPLVLIHGTASRWQPFLSIMPALAKKYQVCALDLRGHGLTSHTPGAYSLKDYTRDVYQFITSQFGVPVAVYGHSLGALVGINLAAQHPQVMRSLILGDPPFYYHDTLTKDTIWHSAFSELLEFKYAHPDPIEMEVWLSENFPGMSAERREERVRSMETLDPEVVRTIISDQLMAGITFPDLPARVTCPVLLLRGNPNLGSALREQDVTFALRNFPSIRVLEMETIGHGIVPLSLLHRLMEFIDTF